MCARQFIPFASVYSVAAMTLFDASLAIAEGPPDALGLNKRGDIAM
jgi:hypothetical protein